MLQLTAAQLASLDQRSESTFVRQSVTRLRLAVPAWIGVRNAAEAFAAVTDIVRICGASGMCQVDSMTQVIDACATHSISPPFGPLLLEALRADGRSELDRVLTFVAEARLGVNELTYLNPSANVAGASRNVAKAT